MLIVIDPKYQMTFEFLLSCWIDDQPPGIRAMPGNFERLPGGGLLYRGCDRHFAALLARQNIPFKNLEDFRRTAASMGLQQTGLISEG